MKKLIFVYPFTDEDDVPFKLDFYETEEGIVTADLEMWNGEPVFADVELVDLFGKKTHVPPTIKEILKLQAVSWAQLEKLEAFQRICLGRLNWSFGCPARF